MEFEESMMDKSADCTIEYVIQFNEAFLLQALRRHRQQAKARFWFLPLKAICFVGISALLALTIYLRLWWVSLLPGIFLLLLVFGSKLDDWMVRRRMRHSPFNGLEVRILLNEQGYTASDAKSRSELAWSVFSRVKRFDDGFLAFGAPPMIYWWPDSAMRSGTVAEAKQLLRRHIARFI